MLVSHGVRSSDGAPFTSKILILSVAGVFAGPRVHDVFPVEDDRNSAD